MRFLHILSALAWFALLPWIFLVSVVFLVALFRPPSAGEPRTVVHEAALAAIACFAVVAPYVFARALDRLVALWISFAPKDEGE